MRTLIALLLCAASASALPIDLSSVQPASPQYCTPDETICVSGKIEFGTFYWGRALRTTIGTTAPGEPMIFVFKPGVHLVGWRSLPVSYGCHTPTVIFCGINLYDGYPICQSETQTRGCVGWSNSTPFNDEWLILWMVFYDVEIWDLYYYP